MKRETVAVVGAGMIGRRFRTRLRELDRNSPYRIVWFGEEAYAPYDRVNLAQYYDHGSAEALALAAKGAYAAQSIDLRLQQRVASIDLAKQVAISESGERHVYQHLVFATGSAPFMPPLPGIDKTGVFAYRTIDDLAAIRAYASGKKSGQRIDLFGVQLNQLPDIWEELVEAGFESGHAYGKAVRTVKSCVGSSWCRYGVQDSVAFAIRVEERYKGIRAPHKLKRELCKAHDGCDATVD